MKELSRLKQLANQEPSQLDEGPVDWIRKTKAQVGSVVQKAKETLSREKGGKDTDTAAQSTGKEFESRANIYLSKANVAGRTLHANLIRQNRPPEEFDAEMFELLDKMAVELASKFRKGQSLDVEKDQEKGEVYIYEPASLVRRYRHPLATFKLISPLPEANAAKGPYFQLTFDSDLNQRTLNLQRLIDKGARPIHPEQVRQSGHPDHPELSGAPGAAPAPAEKPAAPAPAAEKPAAPAAASATERKPAGETEKPAAPAPKPAPAEPKKDPHEMVELNAESVEKHLSALWDRWVESGKSASPSLKLLLKKMYMDSGGIKAESKQRGGTRL